jgi:hypothetical protein
LLIGPFLHCIGDYTVLALSSLFLQSDDDLPVLETLTNPEVLQALHSSAQNVHHHTMINPRIPSLCQRTLLQPSYCRTHVLSLSAGFKCADFPRMKHRSQARVSNMTNAVGQHMLLATLCFERRYPSTKS